MRLAARSRHSAVTVAVAASGPAYPIGGQSASPEVASLALMSKTTGRVNQPSWSGGRSGTAPEISGPLASYLSPYPNGALTLPARSVHVPCTDAAPLSGPP